VFEVITVCAHYKHVNTHTHIHYFAANLRKFAMLLILVK